LIADKSRFHLFGAEDDDDEDELLIKGSWIHESTVSVQDNDDEGQEFHTFVTLLSKSN
jgi:hypothetical protein